MDRNRKFWMTCLVAEWIRLICNAWKESLAKDTTELRDTRPYVEMGNKGLIMQFIKRLVMVLLRQMKEWMVNCLETLSQWDFLEYSPNFDTCVLEAWITPVLKGVKRGYGTVLVRLQCIEKVCAGNENEGEGYKSHRTSAPHWGWAIYSGFSVCISQPKNPKWMHFNLNIYNFQISKTILNLFWK